MWRHDCSRKWPVDCGHESLCSGPHAERTKEQGHSDGHLLAWQPRIESWHCLPVSLLPTVWRKSLWCGPSTITPRFLSAQRSAPASPGELTFWTHSVATLWGGAWILPRLSPAGWKQLPDLWTLGHEMIYICNSCISSNLLQHLQQPSYPVNSPTSGCILGFAHFPLVPTFQNFYTIYKATFGLFLP